MLVAQKTIIICIRMSKSDAPFRLTVADLRPGDRARIETIDSGDPSVQRLMVMGLVEEAEIIFVRRSLGGDPLEIKVHGAAISMRREQARHFTVARMMLDGHSR
jgi:ferrous iron transport protein A